MKKTEDLISYIRNKVAKKFEAEEKAAQQLVWDAMNEYDEKIKSALNSIAWDLSYKLDDAALDESQLELIVRPKGGSSYERYRTTKQKEAEAKLSELRRKIDFVTNEIITETVFIADRAELDAMIANAGLPETEEA